MRIIDRSASPHGEARRSIKECGNYREQTFFEAQGALDLASAITQNDLAAIRMLSAKGADVNAPGKFGMTPLIWALFTESLPAFQELISLGADPDQKLDDNYSAIFRITDPVVFGGDTVLRIALHNKYPEFFMASFPFSDCPNEYSQFGTLLHSFPGPPNRNPVSVLHLMIASGIDVNAKNPVGQTACFLALRNGEVDAVRALIDAGADVDVGNGSQKETVREGINTDIDFISQSLPQLKKYLQKGNPSNAELQVYETYKKTLGLLIEIKAGLVDQENRDSVDNNSPERPVDETDRSASKASEHQTQALDAATTLSASVLNHEPRGGVVMNRRIGERAASDSIELPRPQATGVVANSANRPLRVSDGRNYSWPSLLSVEHWDPRVFFESPTAQDLARAIQVSDFDTANRIVSSGQSVNAVGRAGVSLLFWAYFAGNLEGFRWLLERGADPDQRLSDAILTESANALWKGQTVLGASIAEHHYDFCVAALPNSKDINQKFDIGGNLNLSLLHLAVWLPAPDEVSNLISKLVESGIDINAQTQDGWTAVYVAHIRKAPKLTLHFLKLGADPDIVNGDSGTLREVISAAMRTAREANGSNLSFPIQDLIQIHSFLEGTSAPLESESE